jgi:putative selenate reductase
MPADEHELMLALEDGVEFRELLAPERMEDGQLICRVMQLGEMDASGRAGIIETEATVAVAADTVIAAVGEKVPTDYYEKNGLHVDSRGRALVSDTLESSIPGVYVIGDGLYGPSIVVKGMAQAIQAVEAITGYAVSGSCHIDADVREVYARKGILKEPGECSEAERCLSCSTACENCVDVCPNRANISIQVPGMARSQVIHIDAMCNECGNCRSFCPYASAPYLDKFTLFAGEAEMAESKNDGFAVLDRERLTCKIRYLGNESIWQKGSDSDVPAGLLRLIALIDSDYGYLLG